MESRAWRRVLTLLPFVLASVLAQDVKTGSSAPIPAGVGPETIAVAGASSSQVAAKTKPPSAVTPQMPVLDRVLFDQVDMTLWAASRNFKVGFGPDGATFVPALGLVAPTNMPVTFRLSGITAGGRTMPVGETVAPARMGDRVTFDRGVAREVYDLRLEGVEQSFVLSRPLGVGDHAVHVGFDTALAATVATDGIAFESTYGGVHYGRATAIDAAGRSLALEASIVDHEIVIVVPAAFLEKATWPVTIDPLVSTMNIDASGTPYVNPDVAYDATSQRYAVVAEQVYAQTDRDMYAWICNSAGNVIAGSFTVIDASTTNWTHPSIAFKRIGAQFLVVAERGIAPARQIWGREFTSSVPSVIGSQFAISGNETGDKCNPVVGGDPSAAPPTYYCVAWQRNYTLTDFDIHSRIVTDTAGMHSAVLTVSNGTEADERPAISKSNGMGGVYDQVWTIAWQRSLTWHHDIIGCQVNWNGTTVSNQFAISTSAADTTIPSVSAITDPSLGPTSYLVAYEVFGQHNTVGFSVMQGQTYVGGAIDLAQVEGVGSIDRRLPTATCTGATFTIAYAELWNPNSADYDLYATTLNVVGGTTFSTSEAHALLLGSTAIETRPRITSVHDAGEVGIRTKVVCEAGPAPSAVVSAMYDARAAVGGVTSLATGCQNLGLSFVGQPILGQPVSVTLVNPGAHPLIVVGAPIWPMALCGGCSLGVDIFNNPLVFQVPSVSVVVPGDGALVGATVAIQGADGIGACGYRVTDTVWVTIM